MRIPFAEQRFVGPCIAVLLRIIHLWSKRESLRVSWCGTWDLGSTAQLRCSCGTLHISSMVLGEFLYLPVVSCMPSSLSRSQYSRTEQTPVFSKEFPPPAPHFSGCLSKKEVLSFSFVAPLPVCSCPFCQPQSLGHHNEAASVGNHDIWYIHLMNLWTTLETTFCISCSTQRFTLQPLACLEASRAASRFFSVADHASCLWCSSRSCFWISISSSCMFASLSDSNSDFCFSFSRLSVFVRNSLSLASSCCLP